MKRGIITIVAILLFTTSYGKVQLYLGLRTGAGLAVTQTQLNNFATPQGTANVLRTANSWSLHAKAEALLGFGHFRIGYRFLYNFTPPNISGPTFISDVKIPQYTTYFNSAQSHYFGQYAVLEYAIIDSKHFALTPGIGLGSFTGYNIDRTSGDVVPLLATTHHRFSMSAELNAEIKFGRCVFLFGPNYYLFSLQDKASTNWHQYQNFIGADIGFRVNLIKP